MVPASGAEKWCRVKAPAPFLAPFPGGAKSGAKVVPHRRHKGFQWHRFLHGLLVVPTVGGPKNTRFSERNAGHIIFFRESFPAA